MHCTRSRILRKGDLLARSAVNLEATGSSSHWCLSCPAHHVLLAACHHARGIQRHSHNTFMDSHARYLMCLPPSKSLNQEWRRAMMWLPPAHCCGKMSRRLSTCGTCCDFLCDPRLHPSGMATCHGCRPPIAVARSPTRIPEPAGRAVTSCKIQACILQSQGGCPAGLMPLC